IFSFFYFNTYFFTNRSPIISDFFVNYNLFPYNHTFFYKYGNVFFSLNYDFLQKAECYNFIKSTPNSSNVVNFYSYYNFNSHITYLYVMFSFFVQIPFFLIEFVFSIFDFKKISTLVHNVENLIVT